MEAGSGNWPRLTWNLSRKSYAALASVLASSGAAQMGKEKKSGLSSQTMYFRDE